MPCYKKRQLQRLLLVQPRIAVCRVVQAQILVHKALASACAFRDSVSGELQMHAAQERAVLLVDLESRLELREDAVERASLDACWRAAGIAM